MGITESWSYTRRARPILSARDYDTVKRLVAERATAFLLLETERLEALIRELTDYEDRSAAPDGGYPSGWAELAFVPALASDEGEHRRWSDAAI